MLSLLLEIKTDCTHCGNPLPINAFVEKIFCDKCNKDNVLDAKLWSSLLEDQFKDILSFEDSEGRNSKIMTGTFNFDIMYGRKNARCNSCKTDIPDDELNKFTDKGKYKCAKCSNEILVRPATDLLKSILKSSKYIVSEDENMLKGTSETPAEKDSAKPVLFTCPSCAGNLEIDGKERIVECKFCQSKVYLPDDLWFSLHPVVSKERWYITFDNKVVSEQLPAWDDLFDVAIDKEGNLYFACTVDNFDKELTVWSCSPDIKKRWSVNNLNIDKDKSLLTVSKKGELYVWDSTKHSMSVLSCKDGSLIRKINGGAKTKDNPYTFTVKDCEALISDSDDTLLALINGAFVRFNPDGTRTSLWGDPSDTESKGFFSKLFSGSDDKIEIPEQDLYDIPELDKAGNKPHTLRKYEIKMFRGWDDFIYIYQIEYNVVNIAKYTRRGERVWYTSIQLTEFGSCISADLNGNLFIAGIDENKKSKLLRISPDSKNCDIVLKDISEGGNYVFGPNDMALVSPEGIINIVNSCEELRVFNPDFSVKYVSKNLKEDDDSYREELNRNN
jgi:predicted RNA-binding Zn-ribbon protein involved in translation (DUF1610 family)